MSDIKRFNRLFRMVGEDGLKKLENARVALVGVGAVGSFALEVLVRSGVENICLVDFDTVNLSNINRQLIAMDSSLGQKKIDVAAKRAVDINPNCKIECLPIRVESTNVDRIFDYQPDIVLDAIDIVDGKFSLIRASVMKKMTLFSSMGAARRKDPTKVCTGRFYEVTGCPLAKSLRKQFKEMGEADLPANIGCVYSKEKTIATPFNTEQQSFSSSTQKIPLPSVIAVTGVFGLCLGNLALQKILES